MLKISISQPVSWPTAPPPTMAPVGGVPSVGAVKPSSTREGQADSGRNGQGSPRGGGAAEVSRHTGDGKSNEPQAAPLLPREHSDEKSSSPASQVEEARVRAEQQKADDQKAREKAEQKLQLQEVLASVWKASAAVVDVVLGRELEAKAVQETAGVVTATGETPSANLGMAGTEPVEPSVRREQEPVAYTVQGASSWPPLEAGQLVDQRV